MESSVATSPDIRYEYTMLFDFYGALLKDKNYSIFEDYTCNDMSLSEIAAEYGITRQGVRDTINRSAKKLVEYEERLGLIKKFELAKHSVTCIKQEIAELKDNMNDMTCLDEHLDNIDRIATNILEEF